MKEKEPEALKPSKQSPAPSIDREPASVEKAELTMSGTAAGKEEHTAPDDNRVDSATSGMKANKTKEDTDTHREPASSTKHKSVHCLLL